MVAPNPRTPWPWKPEGERPEEVAAVVEALQEQFSYIDIVSTGGHDDEEWDAIARVAIRALRGGGA